MKRAEECTKCSLFLKCIRDRALELCVPDQICGFAPGGEMIRCMRNVWALHSNHLSDCSSPEDRSRVKRCLVRGNGHFMMTAEQLCSAIPECPRCAAIETGDSQIIVGAPEMFHFLPSASLGLTLGSSSLGADIFDRSAVPKIDFSKYVEKVRGLGLSRHKARAALWPCTQVTSQPGTIKFSEPLYIGLLPLCEPSLVCSSGALDMALSCKLLNAVYKGDTSLATDLLRECIRLFFEHFVQTMRLGEQCSMHPLDFSDAIKGAVSAMDRLVAGAEDMVFDLVPLITLGSL